MSGFAAILDRSGSPVPKEDLLSMLATLEHRGPDGRDTLIEGPVALGHHHFWTTPEEVGERQPMTAADGRVVVFDGRIDNRDELLGELGSRELQANALSDCLLVLAAHRRWGVECVGRLLGPFAFVISDPQQGFLCGRDLMGDRSLYYYLDDRKLLMASEESAILAYPMISAELDRRRVAHYFAVQVPDDGTTFFRSVRELRPGHLLAVDRSGSRIERYRSRVSPSRITYHDDGEYAGHYRELLQKSVDCRIRATTNTAVMMSGGLDSTSLTALAAAGSGGGSRERVVRPASWVFDELELCDERVFMGPMIERYGLDPIQVSGDDAWPLARPDFYCADPNTPEENAYRELKTRLYAEVANSDLRVVLNGGSADVLYTAARGRLPDWMDEWWSGRLESGLRHSAWWLRHLGGSAARAERRRRSWLTPEAEALIAPEQTSRRILGRRPEQARAVLSARAASGLAHEISHANRAGLDLRHPYRDRRLVEFMFAIPRRQLYRDGRYKHVASEAMTGLLPEAIRNRVAPTYLTPLFNLGVRDKESGRVRQLLDGKGAVWPHYVRKDWLEETLRSGASRPVDDVVLWNCIAFEHWRRRHGWN